MKRLGYKAESVCQLCEFISTQIKPKVHLTKRYSSLGWTPTQQQRSREQLTPRSAYGELVGRLNAPPRRSVSGSTPRATPELIKQQLRTIDKRVQEILRWKTGTTISEKDALDTLRALESVARATVGAPGVENKDGITPASALLTLDANTSQPAAAQSSPPPQIPSQYRTAVAVEVSKLAHDIIEHQGVFITPAILKTYVSVQALVGHPETLPEAFSLYAGKPIPKPNTPPIQYKSPNPNKASSAIPISVAGIALTAAIEKKDLSLALAIIDTTICTPAFHRSKIIRRAVPPLTGFALAPLAVYTLASQLSVYQESMDTTMATNVAFAGILAYVGFTATIGMVAVTTANDQMDRVTWATGMPLRERWLKEEERAALDRVAGAWGFTETWRRGEEEGREWEELREWIGRRGMVLDRVELMEGME